MRAKKKTKKPAAKRKTARQQLIDGIPRRLRAINQGLDEIGDSIAQLVELNEKHHFEILLMSRLVARVVYDVRMGRLKPLPHKDEDALRHLLREAAKTPILRDS